MDIKVNSNISFCELRQIPKNTDKVTSAIIDGSKKELEEICKDVDLEIIFKKGFFTKIKSLIFFATNKGKTVGDWFSLSIDKKGYMPQNNPRYLTVDEYTKENILEAAQKAKNNLHKYNWDLPKPAGPVDLVLLAKFFKH